ncbi:hypothetical protein [Clostridium sporogenes]|uniref:hypothetical protein n=1 Tax=Clostridium TaxID=1485 RepID=UPI00223711A4|nr:hypothetical protein [Clostridium sporogenes]MCW6076419.1 hypothetical protein [Clostridium sporogenes]
MDFFSHLYIEFRFDFIVFKLIADLESTITAFKVIKTRNTFRENSYLLNKSISFLNSQSLKAVKL